MGNIVGGVVGGLLGRRSGRREAQAIRESGERAAAQFQPFIEPGAQANQAVLSALGFGGDQAATDAAFQNFLGSTGFQTQLREGQQAITSSQAARGLLGSGDTLRRLQGLGQGLAQQGFQNFIGNLSGVANRGIGAAGGAASAFQSAGQGAAAAGARGAGALQSGLGQATQGVFSRLGIGA